MARWLERSRVKCNENFNFLRRQQTHQVGKWGKSHRVISGNASSVDGCKLVSRAFHFIVINWYKVPLIIVAKKVRRFVRTRMKSHAGPSRAIYHGIDPKGFVSFIGCPRFEAPMVGIFAASSPVTLCPEIFFCSVASRSFLIAIIRSALVPEKNSIETRQRAGKWRRKSLNH